MTKEELREILDKHGKYIRGETGGERANLRGADLRRADLRRAVLRGANLYGADLDGANLEGAYLSGANLEGANLAGADLRDANLEGANLDGANLAGANLYGAYLEGADLAGANLAGAYLRDANLAGVDLRDTEILSFSLGMDFAFLHISDKYPEGTYLKIGCEGHSLRHWQENYRQIGENNGYTKKYIQLYGMQIDMLAKCITNKKGSE